MDANRWKTLGKLVVSLIAAGVLAAGVAMPVVLGSGILARNEAARFLNTTCDLQESPPPQKTTLYASDGTTVLATLFTQDRQPVPLTQIPKYLQDALVATEDRRFYSHHGVDLRGLIRSAISTGSGDTQGGSTLTMQYVKQIRYFQAGEISDPTKQAAAEKAAIAQNLQRKIEDAKCALYFEGAKHESKDEILDNYLNIAFFGENAYGIQVAAETYFGVPASQLTLAQSAMLVGLLRAPSDFDPYYNLTAATERRNEVLQNLVAVGKLSQKVADQQKATAIALATKKPPVVQSSCANADDTSNPKAIPNVGFFCDYVENWLQTNNGITPAQLSTGGYKIVTTLDANLQASMQKRITKEVSPTSPMTAVMPVVDPTTGNVLAMASSKTYGNGPGQTYQPIFTSNTAFGASTFKLFPLLVALQTGIPDDWQLSTVGNQGSYTPTKCQTAKPVINGDDNISYNTVEQLQTAAAKSDNTYFVKLAEDLLSCQLQPIVDLAKKMGISGLDQPSDRPGQTWAQEVVGLQRAQQLVLGSIPTSPLQLAGAYGAVANGGSYNAPSPIRTITTADGQAVTVKRSQPVPVVSPQVAAQAENILEGDTHTSDSGTSGSAFSGWYGANGSEIAGKTGTNQGVGKDASKNTSVWFVGMTKAAKTSDTGAGYNGLVATTALINFDTPTVPSSKLPALGLKAGTAYGVDAARVWIAALGPTLKKSSWSWPDPDNVDGVIVPDVAGDSTDEAKNTLQAAGFQMSVLGAANGSTCASSEPYDSIGYYGPHKATPGSTVTVCMSSGVPNYTPPYIPPPKKKTPTTKPTTGSGSGNGNGNGHRPTR